MKEPTLVDERIAEWRQDTPKKRIADALAFLDTQGYGDVGRFLLDSSVSSIGEAPVWTEAAARQWIRHHKAECQELHCTQEHRLVEFFQDYLYAKPISWFREPERATRQATQIEEHRVHEGDPNARLPYKDDRP